MYEEMIQYVRKFFESNDITASDLPVKYPFRNRFDHSMRVYKWALRINEQEKGDKEIISIAAIFHDVGKSIRNNRPHAEVGAEICEQYLKEAGFAKRKRDRIARAVRLHSSKLIPAEQLLLEDRILIDADLLDEVGALAILWDSMSTALENDASYLKAYERHKKYYSTLDNQRVYLKTECGRILFDERISFLDKFIKNLEYELGI